MVHSVFLHSAPFRQRHELVVFWTAKELADGCNLETVWYFFERGKWKECIQRMSQRVVGGDFRNPSRPALGQRGRVWPTLSPIWYTSQVTFRPFMSSHRVSKHWHRKTGNRTTWNKSGESLCPTADLKRAETGKIYMYIYVHVCVCVCFFRYTYCF